MAKVKLVILGETYWIKGDEPEDKLKELASMVSDTLRDIEETFPHLDSREKLIMLSLNLAERLVDLRRNLLKIGKRVEECLMKE
ncbi:MAG: cell division protein ZapA [Synergistetes bacterium]|nr:cell division protein ZapA [Synergistota bacterium]